MVVGYCRFVVFLRTIIIIVVLDKNAIDFLFNVPEKMQKFLCIYYKITSVNCRKTQSKGKTSRNLKKSGGSGNDLPLQNVLLVKGGESNADKTQVGRISAAGDGHLRRRGLPLSFVQTEQPRGRRGRLSGSLSPAAAGRHRFPRHRAPESMAAARNAQPVRRSSPVGVV